MNARRIAAWVWARPWVVLVAGGLALALVFPRVTAGTIGRMILAGVAGVGLLALHRRYAHRVKISPRVAGWIALGVVTVAAIAVFAPLIGKRVAWPHGDWGPQHAVLSGALDDLANGTLSHWNHRIATGDSPLEVYPAFTYVLAGVIALISGREQELPSVMIALGVVAHFALCLNATRFALRFMPAPAATCVGLLLLVDLGSISSGGVIGTIQWGLLHTAVSQAFTWCALVAVVDAIRRPRLRTSIAIWVFTALAVASHPASLLSMSVLALALLVVALLASDVPPRRALAALGHVLLGAVIAAAIWLPLGERILLYGQHFSNILYHPAEWLSKLLERPVPEGSFTWAVYLGYGGLLAALWSRRAIAVLVAASGIALLFALGDTPYLAFDLAPSQSVARLGADRFYGLSRPFVFVAAGYAAVILYRHAREAWRGVDLRTATVAAAIGGVLGFGALKIVVQTATYQVDRARLHSPYSESDATVDPLIAWAREQMASLGPDRWARAYFYNTPAHYHHLTALTGMPTFHIGPIPNVLMRERIENDSAANLRRYNVRWIIAHESSGPLPLGDPKTERKVGAFVIREVPTWDGKFARIERGAGTAVVRRLDDHVVEVELRDTQAPALVALGTGYYPRWRAHDATGRELPVYAYPGVEGGNLHVVAAWIPPGVTRFTPDGALPSDGRGRWLSIAALLAAIAGAVAWRVRRLRLPALRSLARGKARLAGALPRLLRPGIVVVLGVLVAWGVLASRAPVRALQVEGGLLRSATVFVRPVNTTEWRRCDYARTLGEFHCGDLAVVGDTTWAILNDEQPLWQFTTPTIYARARTKRKFDLRIRMQRHLAGRYWAGTLGNAAEIAIEGLDPVVTNRQRVVDIPDEGSRDVVISVSTVPQTGFHLTFVEERTLIPARDEPVAPPTPPPGL